MSQTAEESIHKMTGKRQFLFVAIEESFLSRERCSHIQNGQIHTSNEAIERVDKGPLTNLFVLKVGREYFAEGHNLFENYMKKGVL